MQRQVRLLSTEPRATQVDGWLGTTLEELRRCEAVASDPEPRCRPGVGGAAEGGGSGGVHCAGPSGAGPSDADRHGVGSPDSPSAAGGAKGTRSGTEAQLPVLLLRFYRSAFELLEGIKLDLANDHLRRLLEEDSTLSTAIALHPNDFVRGPPRLPAPGCPPRLPAPVARPGCPPRLPAPRDKRRARPQVMLLNAAEEEGVAEEDGLHDEHGIRLEATGGGAPQGLRRHSYSFHPPLAPPHPDGDERGGGYEGVGGAGGGSHGDGRQGEMRHASAFADAYAERYADGYVTDRLEGPYADPYGEGSRGGGGGGEQETPGGYVLDGGRGGEARDGPRTRGAGERLGGHERLSSHEPAAQEGQPELLEAVMQQWLQTPAGQSAAQEASRLELHSEEVGQFFHARLLQSLGRMEGVHEGALRGAAGEGDLSSGQYGQAGEAELTEEEEEAVERLVALGYARAQAVEAYLACERHEMLAANYLMDAQ